MGAAEFNDSGPSSTGGSKTSLKQNAAAGNSSAVSAAAGGNSAPTEHRDLQIRIARDGTWFYRGSLIARLPLVKLFASVLRREADGSYWLVTPAERGRVEVEDAPFLAVELTAEGEGREQQLIFRTNLDDIVTAGPDHPLRTETAVDGEPSPYILVRDGLEALLARPVFYQLVDLGGCLLYTSPSPRDLSTSRMPSSA